MYLRLAVSGFLRLVRAILAGRCVHGRFFALALFCARPALAALTLDSTTCSSGAIANCPKEHIAPANCILGSRQEICTFPVSIGAAGPNTLLIASVTLQDFSGKGTAITSMSVGTAANSTTQWTLVPNSKIAVVRAI